MQKGTLQRIHKQSRKATCAPNGEFRSLLSQTFYCSVNFESIGSPSLRDGALVKSCVFKKKFVGMGYFVGMGLFCCCSCSYPLLHFMATVVFIVNINVISRDIFSKPFFQSFVFLIFLGS